MDKAPPISKDLIEYLDRVFSPAFIAARSDAPPHEIAAMVHRENGKQIVIQHLKSVYDNQQLEDPLNVSQDTEGT